ncbi:hypothetical protein M9H77_23913 [Catharanthus roseus]|uniref:Uncharacterized protein n=1 Tax=Catharanthus roseus TaxID=4058 RepID=A0ACC0AW57_CATRO|nr:hypothetical protein M9H77_23913 [Catharanthus roseus]
MIHIKEVSEQPPVEGLIMSMDGHMHTQSHQEGTSDPSMMNLNETLRSIKQSIAKLAKDVEDIKKGGHQGIPQVRGGRRGGLGGRGYYRPKEEYPRHEAWNDGNFYEDYGDNPHVGQAYHGGYYGNEQGDKALEKIKYKMPIFKGESDPNPKKEYTPKVAFKGHFKPKVEEKGKLISNPTRCFSAMAWGHIALSYQEDFGI